MQSLADLFGASSLALAIFGQQPLDPGLDVRPPPCQLRIFRDVMTAAEVAALARVSKPTVGDWARCGVIPSRKIGSAGSASGPRLGRCCWAVTPERSTGAQEGKAEAPSPGGQTFAGRRVDDVARCAGGHVGPLVAGAHRPG